MAALKVKNLLLNNVAAVEKFDAAYAKFNETLNKVNAEQSKNKSKN